MQLTSRLLPIDSAWRSYQQLCQSSDINPAAHICTATFIIHFVGTFLSVLCLLAADSGLSLAVDALQTPYLRIACTAASARYFSEAAQAPAAEPLLHTLNCYWDTLHCKTLITRHGRP